MNEALAALIVPGTDPDTVASYATLAERAADAVFGFEDEVVIVDIETTGWDPDRDAIIEIAAALMRGPEIVETFHTMVDPGRPVPPEIVKLCGIHDADVTGAPAPEPAATRLAEFVAGRDVVAHNASFDRSFLTRAAGAHAFRGAWIDSLQVARIAFPRLRAHRLVDLARAFGAHAGVSHRATDDVASLARVWRCALVGLSDLPAGVLARIAALAPGAPWGVRGGVAHIAAGSPGGGFDLRELRRRRVSADKAPSLDDAAEMACVVPPREEVLGEFSEEGIAGRMYPGFERRDEQLEMAAAVLEAFRDGTHAAIEAGTGVGKSIAYLVPGALFALANGVGVGVATKTNSLMDQLVFGELPALNEALGDKLRYVSLKGYEHYLCLRKLERWVGELDDTADEETLAIAATIIAWTAQSSWGDLDSVNVHWGRRDVRAAITCTQSDCTKKRCRYFPNNCYLHGVRRRASSAHVVVTNHALLFRDVVAAGGILPPIRHWIVDEAHASESEARKQLSLGASHGELAAVLSALHGRRGGLLDNMARSLRTASGAGDVATLVASMSDQVGRCATLADSVFEFVKELSSAHGEKGYDSGEVRVTTGLRDEGGWGHVDSTGRSLVRRLEPLLADGRRLMTALEELGTDFAEQRADLAGLLTRIADQQLGLVSVLDGEADEFVYSVRFDRRANVDAELLRAARLDVGEVLAQEFMERSLSVIFTSATIATGTSFDHFAHSVGLDRLTPDKWRALRLESSYDFERQMSVFIPTDIAEPGARAYLGDMERLLEGVHQAMGGSVLTLFTNRRDMEALYSALEPRLEAAGIPLLVQGRGASAKRLRDEFLADKRLSLFATKSFWEGFDAPGETLRCVVVPKLPFGQVSDPLYEERREREGQVAWSRYYLPEAVLELKQAAGRLIRSSTDTGCLIIADARVVGGKRYSADFIGALPVRDIELAEVDDLVTRVRTRFGS